MSSFHVDSRINLKLEYELAIRLGELILGAGTEDKQLLALGHKLANMDDEKQDFVPRQEPAAYGHFSGPKKDWNEIPREKYAEFAREKFVAEKSEHHIPVPIQKVRANKIRWGIQ